MSLHDRPLRLGVTGREGQLVRSLAERGHTHGIAVVPLGRPRLDLTRLDTVAAALGAMRPDVIVNAAAFTGVDAAEADPWMACAVNAAGAGAVAEAAAALAVPVIQISTDYVFDGSEPRPYTEDDPTTPLGVYGRSKLAGEEAVARATPDHVILRTAWVYSPFGANFVKTMLRLATVRDTVSVVADQQGCPTSALDLADGVLVVARRLVNRPEDRSLRGIFNMVGAEHTDWASFATAIFAAAAALGGPHASVRTIATADYITPARRPANSRLDCGKLARVYGLALPSWRTSLPSCVERLLAEVAA